MSPDEVKEDATPIFNVVHPDDLERVRKSFNEAAKQFAQWRDECRVKLPTGKTIWVEGIAAPQTMEDGSIVCHRYIADITERKGLDQQILRAQRMESVGSLAAGIVHDMNNILSPIMMVLQVLRRKLTEARDQQLLDLLESNSKRAAFREIASSHAAQAPCVTR